MVALVETSTAQKGDGRPGTASTAERTAERRPGTAGSISQSVRSMYSCKSSLVKERFFCWKILEDFSGRILFPGGFGDVGVFDVLDFGGLKDFDAQLVTMLG